MPVNIEIKYRVRDETQLRERIERLSETPVEVLRQTDTFFRSDAGRLKLRQESGSNEGVLIDYQRADERGPRASRYRMARSSDPETLGSILGSVLGVLGTVSKTRRLYRIGRTRVHLDDVEGLGRFLELEVVLGEGDSEAEGRREAEALMRQLGIERVDLVDRAYLDLLLETGGPGEISDESP